ncbi:MAG: inositol monophosphatase [Thermoflexales bacterium]|nr:inositol monophosphatase [Thermoflexales bacterium]MCS7325141.1 inositol monophosphatase [Thermoflexales bacterium]MCX7938021.1 inositol monophosphatase [Thermoflexales bacterium]MDW8054460.1 inositol monophosphatase family protein [Anaerolineae bacterium]MDW8292750.1 inositol monophosphatase family protein [Anaerolineae bacterium]
MALSTAALLHVLEQAIAIARGAGELLREGFAQAVQAREQLMVNYKTEDVDPVTIFDRRSEDYIVSALRAAFPHHRVVGEEGGEYASANGHRTALTWHVDPLDGTVNFAHGFPIFAVSLGLLDEQRPIVGVVYNPIMDELFAAAEGLGATLNGKPIRVSTTPTLGRALLNTGFPYDVRTSDDNNFDLFARFHREAQAVRRVGSAALDLCWVACGRMDGYWEFKVKPHDIAAGIVVVREAGGRVTDFVGGERMFARGEVLATNGLIHDAMLRVIAEERVRA